jgi:RecA-family ATPase
MRAQHFVAELDRLGSAHDDRWAQMPEDENLNFETVTLAGLLRETLPRRELILAPIIPVRGLAMLFAGRGTGKTHVGMGMGYAIASGATFLRWHAAQPRRVLYVDGEMPQEALQERARSLAAATPYSPPDESYFTILPMDRQKLGVSINLSKPEHQAALEKHLDGIEFLVIDNISTLVNGGRENDADSWDAMQAWLLQLRRRGVSVLLIHHAGRGDNARGTSKREDVLDTVIQLKRPEDYDMEEGARFEVHLTKARGVVGDDAQPFEAKLDVVDGVDRWTCQVLRDRELDRVAELSAEGMSVRDIGAELNLSKSKIQRMQAKLRAEGQL